jgi:hypothetical protein
MVLGRSGLPKGGTTWKWYNNTCTHMGSLVKYPETFRLLHRKSHKFKAIGELGYLAKYGKM